MCWQALAAARSALNFETRVWVWLQECCELSVAYLGGAAREGCEAETEAARVATADLLVWESASMSRWAHGRHKWESDSEGRMNGSTDRNFPMDKSLNSSKDTK